MALSRQSKYKADTNGRTWFVHNSKYTLKSKIRSLALARSYAIRLQDEAPMAGIENKIYDIVTKFKYYGIRFRQRGDFGASFFILKIDIWQPLSDECFNEIKSIAPNVECIEIEDDERSITYSYWFNQVKNG